jgi:hypothetical protein
LSGQAARPVRQVGTELMSNESRSATGSSAHRGVRLVLVSSGAVFMALLAILAVMAIVPMLQQGHTLAGVLLALAALLVLLLAGRAIVINWHAVHRPAPPPSAPDGSDQTGIWGVGGPSMREPGSTGAWPMRNVDRRYEESDN